MNIFFKYLFLISISSTLFCSCGEDNDDFVLPEDVSNINLETGIVFGLINNECAAVDISIDNCNEIFRYTGNKIVATDITENVPLDGIWTFDNTNLGVVDLLLVRGLENLPRGLRDFPSTSIVDFQQNLEGITNFYVFEFDTSAGRKTIQFKDIPAGASDEIKAYFSEMITITNRLSN